MRKTDVGSNAGDIYMLLSRKGKLSLRQIGEFTNRREAAIFLSLGWLLRENKVSVMENNGRLYFELNHTCD